MWPRSPAVNQSPTRDATAGPATAVTPPSTTRERRSSPKEPAAALQIIAAPQSVIVAPSSQVRRTRSVSAPKGRDRTAPTSEVTATRSPMSVVVMCSEWRSSIAAAPTVAVSALDRASTHASTTITRVRRRPPSTRTARRWAERAPRRAARLAASPIAGSARRGPRCALTPPSSSLGRAPRLSPDRDGALSPSPGPSAEPLLQAVDLAGELGGEALAELCEVLPDERHLL